MGFFTYFIICNEKCALSHIHFTHVQKQTVMGFVLRYCFEGIAFLRVVRVTFLLLSVIFMYVTEAHLQIDCVLLCQNPHLLLHSLTLSLSFYFRSGLQTRSIKRERRRWSRKQQWWREGQFTTLIFAAGLLQHSAARLLFATNLTWTSGLVIVCCCVLTWA